MPEPLPHRLALPRRLRALSYGLAVLLLLMLGATMLSGVRALVASAEWVSHTETVVATVNGTLAATRTAESAARGYRLTERPDLLADGLAAAPQARAFASRLVSLTADNPAQQRRARRLEAAVETRLQELERMVELQRDRGVEVARAETRSSPGPQQMREITRLAEAMSAVERTLLAERRQRSEQLARRLTAAVVIGIAVPLALLSLLLRTMLGETRRSRALEQQARQAAVELRSLLEQRDRLSEQRRRLGSYAGLLQGCQDIDEAMAITADLLSELLPGLRGRCYLMRASQDFAESAAQFGTAEGGAPIVRPDECWALRLGRTHLCRAGERLTCAHAERLQAGEWTLCVPLNASATAIGLLTLTGDDDSPDEDRAIIEAIAEQLSLALVNLQLRESLRIQSLRDALTGLYNRRYLQESLPRELQRCIRRGQPLSVLMFDVDHFKRFNDSHGHAAGDALLARIGQVLQEHVRGEDIGCRYGGEEFTLVMPETDKAAALARAEALRATIAGTTVTHQRQLLGPSTASLGVATFPDDGLTPDLLIEHADAALYRAKAQGRDRVAAA